MVNGIFLGLSKPSLSLSLSLNEKRKQENKPSPSVIQEARRMMSSRRRQSMDYMPPRSSSNKKRMDILFHHPLRWSNTTTHSDVDADVDESPSSTTAAKSSDQMLMMMAMMMGRQRVSSFGSCGGGLSSLGSLMDHGPPTPSPICSPVSSLSWTPPSELRYFSSQLSTTADDHSSFATPNQSSCIISNDGKKSASLEEAEVEGEEKGEGTKVGCRKASKTPDHPSHKKKVTRGGEGSSIQALTPKPNHKLKPTRMVRHRIPGERNDPLETMSSGTDDGRLFTVSEEQELRWRNKNHLIMSSRLSSAENGYYSGSSGSGSGYNSDIENMIEERLHGSMTQAWERPFHSFAAPVRRSCVEDKLKAWKEARTMKLMNKLSKKAEAIDEWEKKQITKAKMDMKEFETKMEKRRSRAMEKMQRTISTTQKTAEKKKLMEHAAAAKKMARVNKTFDKISTTGKLPWMLVFL